MDPGENESLDQRAVAAAELAETAEAAPLSVQASAEKDANVATLGEAQEPVSDTAAAPDSSGPCETRNLPASLSSRGESKAPANEPIGHDPTGPSTPPLERIASPPSQDPSQKDPLNSARLSTEPQAPGDQRSGPLTDFVPPPIPPFKQKSLPTAKPPSTTYRERSARFKRKRQEKQTGARLQAFPSGTAYPFHHSFRAIPGEKLPNGQSPYPGTAPPGAPLYTPLVAPPKGDILNATALAQLTGTYLGFPWLSIAVSGPPNLGADSQDGRARKRRAKGADPEAPRMMADRAPSPLLSFDTGRKPRWKPAPAGFTKCAACVWSRRATGYCYLKHGGGKEGARKERASADDGASEKDADGDRSKGDGGGRQEGAGATSALGSEGASEKDADGDGGEGDDSREPAKNADERGVCEAGGAAGASGLAPENTIAGDKAAPDEVPAEPSASLDGKTGDDDATEAHAPADAAKDSESAEERGDKEAREGGFAEGALGEGLEAGGTDDDIQNGDTREEQVTADGGAGGDGQRVGKDSGGRLETGGGTDVAGNSNAEGRKKALQSGRQNGGEGARGAENGQPVTAAVSGQSGTAPSDPLTAEPQSKGLEEGRSPVPAGKTPAKSLPSVGFSFLTVNEAPQGKRKEPDSADEKGPGRPKPCNACRKVRKGGCGTPRAYSGCEVWKPEVREWPRKRGEERELRPWPAHLPPEAHAQIQTVAADPLRADSAASAASRIPYLYFGRSPSGIDPGSENGLGVSPAPYSRLTPASYLSRLNQSSAVPSGPALVDLFAKPPANLRAQISSVPKPGPGPLSQQVSEIFSSPYAALRSHQPSPPQLPPIAHLIDFRSAGSNLAGHGVRMPVPSEYFPQAHAPQSAPSRYAGVPVKVLNPNARTPDANPVVPLSILPVQIQIPVLPVFRNPPTASIGAQLPAPTLSSSNQPLLGSFLQGREAFAGGQPSADVIRIRGGGPRPRKRKQTDGMTGGAEKKARNVAAKKGSGKRDGALGEERKHEATAGGENDAGAKPEEASGSKGRGAAEEGSSGVTPEREGLRRSSRVRKGRETGQTEEAPSNRREAPGARGRSRSAAKASTERSEGAGPSGQGDASKKEKKGGGKARTRKAESTVAGGKKATSEGEAKGGGRKGRTTGTKRRKKGDGTGSGGSRAGGVGTSAAKKARGGAKGKGASGKAPLIVFAHGAGAGSSSPFMQRWRDLLREALGAVDVVTFDYPYLASGKKGAPPKAEKLVDFHIATIKSAQEKYPGAPLVLIGKSMGSRVSCMIGGREDSGLDVAAVVCLGYPLKGMGKGPLREQTLLDLKCPVLFVQGSKDSMCPLDSLADVRERMSADNNLYVVEGGDHGLSVGVKALAAQELTKEEAESAALEAIATFLSPLL
ncbi:alpha/beta-Hydrolases superfamily protein [Klebsormidium nitens]|uniref:Alpha/beta-Hydrolases superfamily protein n=1 Tax=Klebsormidium nitens TaxID=105231 RepID=A0A1Y1IKS0_KLENI|nr:alpha/beta-Hydrolases superfamily protein [Klebsormidium nitens]|eukprot:GAQ90019.1 alpha/beta-Hydrolases superfamily protein [Klebsormidium nitens]